MASDHDLQRLVKLLLGNETRSGQYIHSASQMRKNGCLAEALCSAQFWELPNLRSALLQYLLMGPDAEI